MANRYTVTSGLASAVGTWDGGATVPGTGDRVLICNTGTGANTFSTNTAGYAIGATAITLTGSVLAGSYVVGESVQFAGDPNYYKISAWNNGTKVLTVAALIVAIPAQATLVTNRGHVVELDGTYVWGDDSTSTVTVNSVSTLGSIWICGTLKASRTVSSTLTCVGNIVVSSWGTIDYGTEADPIPAAYTALLILNHSATLANSKYGLYTNSASTTVAGFRFWGAAKTATTTVTVQAAAGDTDVTFGDITGWAVGDWLAFGVTAAEPTYLGVRVRAITALPGGTVATLGANLGVISDVGRRVINLTRNVCVRASNGNSACTGMGTYLHTSHSVADVVEVGPCELNVTAGPTGVMQWGGLNLAVNGVGPTVSWVKKIDSPVIHGVYSVSGSTIGWCAYNGYGSITGFRGQGNVWSASNVYTVGQPNSSNSCIGAMFGASFTIDNPCSIGGLGLITSSYGQGGQTVTINDGFIEGGNREIIYVDASGVVNVYGLSARGNRSVTGYGNSSKVYCYGLEFSDSIAGIAVSVVNAQIQQTALINHTFDSCTWGSAGEAPEDQLRTQADLYKLSSSSYIYFRNINNDYTQNIRFVKGGKAQRDNSTIYRGTSSLALYCWWAGVQTTFTSEVAVGASADAHIVGWCRFNSTYGTATPPTLTVSGMGITPQTFTCTATADTWFPIDLTITNPQVYPGKFTLTFVGQSSSNNQSAICWFDGIAIEDFVTWVQHYGYTYDPTNAARTVDSLVVLSESAAAALTGLAYATGELTISSSHSLSEIYDWMKWYEASNRLAPIFTSTDGVNFTLAADMTLSGAITGTGQISMAGNTLTVSAGTSTVPVIHDAGAFVSISVIGMLAGSRLQLYDVTSATELYNDIPGTTSYTQNAAWTTDHTIRARVTWVDGVTGWLPVEQTALLTNDGAAFLVSQQSDSVYDALAIDGSACSEFLYDNTYLQIDVSDADNTTTVQRIYAWTAWIQYQSAEAIANFFNAIEAVDSLNYIVDTAVVDAQLDNVAATPVIIGGGYLSRNDGTTIIAAASGSIQMDPSRAYQAVGTVNANIVAVNGLTVDGAGTASDPWGPV